MIRTFALLFAFVAVLGAAGYAQNMRGVGASNLKNARAAAGQVNPDGTIATGSNFSVVHRGTGSYELTFSERYFVKGCPIVMVIPVSSKNTYFVQQPRCNVYDVYFYNLQGKLSDTLYNVIAVASE